MASPRKTLPTAAVRRGRLHFANADLDKLLAMVLTLSGEVWALRERCAVIEAVAGKHGVPIDQEVEDFEFDATREASLVQLRNDFMANLFQILNDPGQKGRKVAKPAGKRAGKPAARKTSRRARRPK